MQMLLSILPEEKRRCSLGWRHWPAASFRRPRELSVMKAASERRGSGPTEKRYLVNATACESFLVWQATQVSNTAGNRSVLQLATAMEREHQRTFRSRQLTFWICISSSFPNFEEKLHCSLVRRNISNHAPEGRKQQAQQNTGLF